MIHCLWLFAAKLNCRMQIERVPTKENIADDPSREDYKLLEELQAVRVKAKFEACFLDPGAWEALRLPHAFF